jgi:hypothetical protein
MRVRVEKKTAQKNSLVKNNKKVDWLRLDKKCSPSHGQNGQLVHWWVLVHSGLISSEPNWNCLLHPWQLAWLSLILFHHSRYVLYHVFSLVISVPTLFLCPPNKWGEPLESGILSRASHELLLFNLDIQLNQPDQFHVLKVLKRRKNYVYFICVIYLCDMCCI